MKTLKKDKHYRIIYIHNNIEVIAYISTKLYHKDGGFMFIHKLCSKTGSGQGSILHRPKRKMRQNSLFFLIM